MTFLQPLLLWGLPLIGLPILIHLIHRQRHRTLPWGAMMFLLEAQRLTRGMARIRYWTILALRMLAVGLLFLAAARPLASGLLGLGLGGRPDTILLLLDRSASMEQQDLQSGQSKRSTALDKLAELLRTLGTNAHVVLLDSCSQLPRTIAPGEPWQELPGVAATATTSDIPGLLQAAWQYISENQSGRTDVWIASDLRASDWKPQDGRWAALAESFGRLDGIRFYLLSYPDMAPDNLQVAVQNVRLRRLSDAVELVLDVEARLGTDSSEATSDLVPLELMIDGARSELTLQMDGSSARLQGHAIRLDRAQTAGWGYVSTVADGNAMDNVAWFVYAEPPERHTTIVSSQPAFVYPTRAAAVSAMDESLVCEATRLEVHEAERIDFEKSTLLIWQAPLPAGALASRLQQFADSGRPILFFPPEQPDENSLFGLRWDAWQDAREPLPIASWRGESDVWRNSAAGEPLPIGNLRVRHFCSLIGGATVLARLPDDVAVLVRSTATNAPVYFCATWPHAPYSTLAEDGVAFYVLVQRALAQGATVQGRARILEAGGPTAALLDGFQPVEARASAHSLQGLLPGAFQRQQDWVAVQRPAVEDENSTLDRDALEQLFSGLVFRHMEDRVGNSAGLASEIWRLFLLLMAFALVAEAWLCLPQK